MMRWHGTMTGTGLAPSALPTARAARGWPTRRASAAYESTSPNGMRRASASTRAWNSPTPARRATRARAAPRARRTPRASRRFDPSLFLQCLLQNRLAAGELTLDRVDRDSPDRCELPIREPVHVMERQQHARLAGHRAER